MNQIKISEFCPLLEELTLQGSYRINDDTLIRFVESHPYLKKLELWWLNRITPLFTQSLSISCPGLRELHLVMCTQLDDDSMINYFTSINFYFYTYCCVIVIGPISKMESLQVLHLEKAEGLTDSGVKKALESCKKNIIVSSFFSFLLFC